MNHKIVVTLIFSLGINILVLYGYFFVGAILDFTRRKNDIMKWSCAILHIIVVLCFTFFFTGIICG